MELNMNTFIQLSLQLIWPAAIFLIVMLELWLAICIRKPARQIIAGSRQTRRHH